MSSRAALWKHNGSKLLSLHLTGKCVIGARPHAKIGTGRRLSQEERHRRRSGEQDAKSDIRFVQQAEPRSIMGDMLDQTH